MILASGGFQGNPEMMRAHFGAAAETIKLISPGTRFDTGDGIRIAHGSGRERLRRLERHAHRTDRSAQHGFLTSRAGLSLWHRGRSGWSLFPL